MPRQKLRWVTTVDDQRKSSVLRSRNPSRGSPSLHKKGHTMTAIEYLDRPPPGWFVLDVMRKESGKSDWVALIINVHPDELKHSLCKTAFLYREAWVRVPGEHRNADAAWDALEGFVATRH
jgi:hypothetical protein